MKHVNARDSFRWRSLGSAALAVATVVAIGFTTVTPAKADWRRDGWRDRPAVTFSFGVPVYYGYYSYPAYGYYSYPAYSYSPYYSYPAYGYYSYGSSDYGYDYSR
jgi:hypothetical protein